MNIQTFRRIKAELKQINRHGGILVGVEMIYFPDFEKNEVNYFK